MLVSAWSLSRCCSASCCSPHWIIPLTLAISSAWSSSPSSASLYRARSFSRSTASQATFISILTRSLACLFSAQLVISWICSGVMVCLALTSTRMASTRAASQAIHASRSASRCFSLSWSSAHFSQTSSRPVVIPRALAFLSRLRMVSVFRCDWAACKAATSFRLSASIWAFFSCTSWSIFRSLPVSCCSSSSVKTEELFAFMISSFSRVTFPSRTAASILLL
mmetsp:Transcript_34012/g.88772  ORF Transcript_34012/g.88772 Transcript_34012/m.88772 type:complete len:223 (+) Transcript_34012:1366-2034(+)